MRCARTDWIPKWVLFLYCCIWQWSSSVDFVIKSIWLSWGLCIFSLVIHFTMECMHAHVWLYYLNDIDKELEITNGRIIGSCEFGSFKRSSTCVFFSLPVVKFETFILCNCFPWHWWWRLHTLKAPLTSMLMEISIYHYFHTLVLSGLLIILELCICIF